MSKTNSCIGFIDKFRILSNSLDSLYKTPVDNNHKTNKILKKKETVEDDDGWKKLLERKGLNIVTEAKNHERWG